MWTHDQGVALPAAEVKEIGGACATTRGPRQALRTQRMIRWCSVASPPTACGRIVPKSRREFQVFLERDDPIGATHELAPSWGDVLGPSVPSPDVDAWLRFFLSGQCLLPWGFGLVRHGGVNTREPESRISERAKGG